MEKRHKIFAAISLSSVFILGATIIGKAVGADAFGLLKVAAPASEYKIVLNGSNHLTSSEIANKSFTRNTNLGNPISYSLYGGASAVENANNFFQSRERNGWFCNEDKINGITKIVVSATNGVDYRLEFSNSAPLNHDALQTSPCTFDSGLLAGSYTYEVPDDKSACYFRFQPESSANNWVKFEIYYSCVAECSHDWQHVDKVAANRGNDGIDEHYVCDLCGAVKDKNGNETTLEDLALHSYLYTINSGSTEQTIPLSRSFSTDETVLVDIKVGDEGTAGAIFFGLLDASSSWKRTSNIKIFSNGTWQFTDTVGDKQNKGVELLGITFDGYYRFSCDLSLMDKEAGFTQANRLMIYKWNHNSGFAEVNTDGIGLARGVYYQGSVDYSTGSTGSKSFNDLLVNIDVRFDDAVGNNDYLRIMLGDGWSNYYGYFKITKNGIYDDSMNSLDFVKVSTCDDGYTRYSFLAERLSKNGTPSTFTLFYIHNWSKVSGWVDLSTETHSHDLVKTDAVSPFRENDGNIEYYTCQDEMCGKMFDADNNLITSSQTTDPSRLKRYEAGVDANYHFAKQIPNTEVMTIDFKADNASQKTAIALMQDESWDNYYGYYSFYGDGRPEENYTGVSTTKLLDGYVRITFNLSELNKINNKPSSSHLTGVKWVYVRGEWTGTGGYIDCNVKGGQILRGSKFNTATDLTINFDKRINATSTVNIDVLWLSNETTYINVAIGDWSNYKGYFELTKNTKTNDFSGLVVAPLNDGFTRYSFTLNQCTKWKQDDKTREYINFDHVFIRGVWSTAEGWCDVSYIENLDSPVVGDIY